MQLHYRPELDGLRGFAVLVAIFYHYSLVVPMPQVVKEFTSGAFVAVDVFFVLSGYLISRIVLADIVNSTFTFADFYERRIRRIVPAMLFVVFGTIPLGYYYMEPEALERFGTSILGIGAFAANFIFYLESSYFAPEAHHMPFLHIWSLSLEEQFYIAFPVVLALGWRFSKHQVIWLFCGIFLVSFIYAQLTSGTWPVASFFLPYTRAWQFIAGFFIAYAEYRYSIKNKTRPESQALMILGFLLLLISISLMLPTLPHPSIYTLGVVGGTALMIWFGTTTGFGRLFTARPSRFMGHISYSLYLWHMPLLAFWSLTNVQTSSWLEPTGLLVVAFGISVLSWKYIEQPCRKKTLPFSSLVLVLLPLWALMLAVGGWFKASEGQTERFSYPAELSASFEPAAFLDGVTFCHNGIQHPHKSLPLCKMGATKNNLDFLLLGDSHAWAATPGFDLAAQATGLAGGVQTHSACPHILGVSVFRRSGVVPTCSQLNEMVFDYVKKHNIQNIFLVSSWPIYTQGKAVLVQLNPRFGPKTIAEREQLFERHLRQTLKAYKNLGVNIYVLEGIPQFPLRAKQIYSGLYRKNAQPTLSQANDYLRAAAMLRSQYDQDNAYSVKLFNALEKEGLINKFINVRDAFCDDAVCPIGQPRQSYFYDEEHLSALGAKKLLAPLLMSTMKELAYHAP